MTPLLRPATVLMCLNLAGIGMRRNKYPVSGALRRMSSLSSIVSTVVMYSSLLFNEPPVGISVSLLLLHHAFLFLFLLRVPPQHRD